jgi:hypothetical protein
LIFALKLVKSCSFKNPQKEASAYDLADYNIQPAIEVQLIPGEFGIPLFHPTLEVVKNTIASCFDYIVESGRGLPRIETIIFPDNMDSFQKINLSSVDLHENWVVKIMMGAEKENVQK